MMIGRAPGTLGSSLSIIKSSSGDVASEGPLGDDVFDLRNAGDDFDALTAISASAAARSG